MIIVIISFTCLPFSFLSKCTNFLGAVSNTFTVTLVMTWVNDGSDAHINFDAHLLTSFKTLSSGSYLCQVCH